MTALIRCVLALAFAVCFLPAHVVAQVPPGQPRLDGRWNLVLQTPQGSFPMPVEFVVGSGGRVSGAILGPSGSFRLRETTGTLRGNRLRLSARSSFGNLRVNATLEGNRLRGRWSPAGFVSSLFYRGALEGTRDETYVRGAPERAFDQVWSFIERDFHALDYNGVDVRALRERYRPEAAATRTDAAFLAVMQRLLAEFRTSHLALFATPVPVQESAPAGARDEGITWRAISPSTGYLRIASFEDGQAVADRIDRAFVELGASTSLVIDLRENGGGSLSAAMRLGDHIFAEQRPVGYFASRAGLTRRGAASIDQLDTAALPRFTGYAGAELAQAMNASGAVMLATGGRAPRPYRGRIAILTDEYCFSACEALASVAKETGAATLFGRRTAGQMLASFPYVIEGGWTLVLPIWDFRTPGGVRVEGVGVEPNVMVRAGRDDPELAAALRHLRGEAQPARRRGE